MPTATDLADYGIVEKDGRLVGSKRYVHTSVIRSVYQNGHWVEIERYDDATVQCLGSSNNRIDSRQATLFAYSPDPEDESVHGDEEYREGCGIFLNTKKLYGKSLLGMVLDADGDVATKRVQMDAVTGSCDYGHGNITYTGVVSFKERTAWGSGSRAVNEWVGGGDLSQLRLEQWDVRVKRGADEDD